MTAKQIKLMQDYLQTKGYSVKDILHMTVTQLIDAYYKEKGVEL